MDTQQAFKQVLAAMREIYEKKLSDPAQDLWWSLLRDYSGEQIKMAMEAHLRDPEQGRFPPKPSDLIAKITGTSKQRDTAIQEVAEAAWIEVLRLIRSIGAYGSVAIDDKVALKAITMMGGWVNLCHTPLDKMEWRRKEFIECYKNSMHAAELPASLAGIGQKSMGKLEASEQLARLRQGAQKRLN